MCDDFLFSDPRAFCESGHRKSKFQFHKHVMSFNCDHSCVVIPVAFVFELICIVILKQLRVTVTA